MNGRSLRLGTCLSALTFLLVPAGVAAQERGDVGIALGETPELVQIEDLDGNPVSLASFATGKPVLFEFWATWCESCEALEPQMEAAYDAFGDRMEFVAVAVAVAQTTRRVKRHRAGHEVGWPTLWDKGGAAVRAFLAPATSYIVIIDTDGGVVYTGIGPEQDIVTAVRRVLGEID
jgi:thiol-disulfide isomerase/thioredoxin